MMFNLPLAILMIVAGWMVGHAIVRCLTKVVLAAPVVASIGNVYAQDIAALHPPDASVREDKPAATVWWWNAWKELPKLNALNSYYTPPPPTRVKTIRYREDPVFMDFPPFPAKPVKTITYRQ